MANLGIPKHPVPSDAMTVKGGGPTSASGPTGSSRSYPKGAAPANTKSAPFDPHTDKDSGSSIYVGGV